MKINNRYINESEKPYIIAELSANHGGSLSRAKQSIIEASKSGIDAIKIQTYTPDTMTIKSNKKDFIIEDGLWAGNALYDLYQSAYTPFEWHKDLFDCAKENNITIFSSPFDESAVDLLESLDTPAYKVASFEIVDIPLIEYIAEKRKPILMSTGMASIHEIEEAVSAIRRTSDSEILLFHCISSYPAPTNQSNLNNILSLKDKFQLEVGLSDHTISNLASTVAIGMGASAIEKHFKLDEEDCGPDSSFSLNISQLSSLVYDCNEAWLAKGNKGFSRAIAEKDNIKFRRSIYFVNDLSKGSIITSNDIKRIRPGFGLEPKYYNEIIGKKLLNNVERGDPVSWNLIDEG